MYLIIFYNNLNQFYFFQVFSNSEINDNSCFNIFFTMSMCGFNCHSNATEGLWLPSFGKIFNYKLLIGTSVWMPLKERLQTHGGLTPTHFLSREPVVKWLSLFKFYVHHFSIDLVGCRVQWSFAHFIFWVHFYSFCCGRDSL